MASIDERVVAMSFENAKFESGVAVTMGTLSKLNASIAGLGKNATGFADIEKAAAKVNLLAPMSALDKLKAKLGLAGQGSAEAFGAIEKSSEKVSLLSPMTAIDKLKGHFGTVGSGAAQGFSDIEKASNRVNLLGLNSAIDSVTSKFSAMTVVASSALNTIVMDATRRGKELVNALTLGPVTGGLQEYATNLNSIQTILANTEASGAGLKDVNKALQQLNAYSDQTIYNFSQMAQNIGTFTAAGVDLDTATASIKGIANLAALSGSNAEQASRGMYQLSQAIAAGRVSLQDWNSVVGAGMGGTVFQRALANTAQSMGTLGDGAVELKGKMKNVTIEGQSFRESITASPGEKSWLTSKVLTNTLKQFTGDLSAAELQAQGFNDEQIKAIQKTAETAKKAATEVKTLKGVFDVAKESIGSGWAATFQVIFGTFTEAKKTFTDLSEAIQGMIGDSADARNKVLGDWKELGGRKELIEGVKAAFEALSSVLKPIRDAFRDIFPRKTGEDLFELTVRFREFMEELKIGPETAENLKRTFRGFFALLSIGKTIVSGVVGVIFDLLGVVGDGSGGFLAFTGSIGDFLVALDAAISKGKGLEGVFEGLSNVLRTPLELLKAVASAIGGLFGEDDAASADDISGAFDRMAASAGPLESALRAVAKVWSKFFDVMQDIGEFILPILDDVRDVFASIGDKVVEGLEGVDYDKVMTAIQTTFLGGLAIGIKKLLGGIGVDLTGGLVKNFKQVTDTLSGTLVAIQRNVNARTMLLIAGAVLALAAATIIFSQIDAKQLGKAMTAISVGIGQLVGAMALLTKVGGKGAFLTLPFIAASMLVLAAALVVLGAAVKIFSTMSWEELARGLSGVAVGLAAIAAATKFMGPGIILIGPGLVAVAVAMNLLAVAMKIFGGMKWEEIAKGLVGISGALLAVGIAVKGLGPGMLVTGPGLILVAAGLILLSGAVSSFGNMDLKTMGKGLLGIATALVVLGVAISAVPPTIAIQAAGLVILGIALTGIAAAVGAMGSLGILTIAKGLTAIAAALVIFAVGLTAMAGTLPGSVALLAAAAAFAVLTPALVVLGSLKWSTIIKGLGAIALTLGVLAVVGALASGPLTALGLALALMSASVLIVGAGIFLMAKGFSLLGSEGVKGVSVMIAAITAFIALLPKMVIDFLKGLVEILGGLAKLAPQIAESLVSILKTWFTALEDLLPQAAELIGKLLAFIVQTIEEHSGPLIDAGFQLLLKFLSGIANNIGKVTENVALVITRFLSKLAEDAPKIAAAGASALAAWLRGIASNIGRVIAGAASVVTKFLEGIVRHLPAVYATGVKVIVTYLKSVADALPKIIAAGVRIIVRFLEGIGNAIPEVIKAGARVVRKFLFGLAEALPALVDAGFKAVIKFLHGIAKAIRDNDDEMIDAGWDIASAIGEGLIKGLASIGPKVKDAIGDIIKSLPGKALDILGIHSPSKVFQEIGKFTMLGLAKGIKDNNKPVNDSAKVVGNIVIDTFRSLFGIHSPSEVMRELGQFVGEGFAQGLHGSKDEINTAFKDLNGSLRDQIRTSRQTIAEEQTKLNELLKEKKPDLAAIKESQKVIAQNELIIRKSRAAHATLVEALGSERNTLLRLTNDYDRVSKKLEAANSALDAAISARDSAKQSLTDKFATTPTIDQDSETMVSDYVKALREQITATKSYSETLAKLRALGLDDATYQKLLDEGLAGKDFAESLLSGGKTAVDGINSLDTELLAASTTLATNAANELYQAGVDAAQGLVNGLKSKKKELADTMDFLADELVKAIKRKLKIKSPSQAFAEIGKFSAQGLAQGFKNSSKDATDAASQLGTDTVKAMQNSIADMSSAIADNIDSDPVITPVLDLSNVKKGAQEISDLASVTPITAAPSFRQAAAISEEQQASMTAQAEQEAADSPTFIFEQNNTSPESLSEIEIYRQTSNQLAQAKSILGLAP